MEGVGWGVALAYGPYCPIVVPIALLWQNNESIQHSKAKKWAALAVRRASKASYRSNANAQTAARAASATTGQGQQIMSNVQPVVVPGAVAVGHKPSLRGAAYILRRMRWGRPSFELTVRAAPCKAELVAKAKGRVCER